MENKVDIKRARVIALDLRALLEVTVTRADVDARVPIVHAVDAICSALGVDCEPIAVEAWTRLARRLQPSQTASWAESRDE